MQISRSLSIALGCAALALAGGYFMQQGGAGGAADVQSVQHATPRAAHIVPTVTASAKPILIVIAPSGAAPPGVYRFHKNDSVEFRVSIPYDGMLAIHGYTNDVPIAAHQELRLALKLEHTGRFPMHIHVADGRHIEVAMLEIYPD